MSSLVSKIFITGIAGFIGFHLAIHLKKKGYAVEGCDNFNSYYNPLLKRERARHLELLDIPIYSISLSELSTLYPLFEKKEYSHFIHLAAQAGVRYSLTHPESYIETNLTGFFHVLELCKKFQPLRLIFASSSSVYGLTDVAPFCEDQKSDMPISLYAATKKSNELMAYSYHHLYNIPTIGLRFFTVYGPFGRPDMAYYSFAKAIMHGKPIEVFNHGNMLRDFTYIDDITHGIESALYYCQGFDIFNLGNNKPEALMKLILLLETHLRKKAHLIMKEMQPGDVLETFADISKAQSKLRFFPKTSLEEGIEKFTSWIKTHPDF